MQEKSKTILTNIIDKLSVICKSIGCQGYIAGSYPRYLIGGQFNYVLPVILSAKYIEPNYVLSELRKVGQIEVVSDTSTYIECTISGFLIQVSTSNKFNHQDLPISPEYSISIDTILFHIQSEQVVDQHGGIADYRKKTIRPIRPLSVFDIIGKLGVFDNTNIVDDNLIDYNGLNSIGDEDYQSIITDVLSSRFPGNAIKTIIQLPGGDYWLFNRVLDFLVVNNVSLVEEVSIGNIKNIRKLQLLDAFSNFSSSKRTSFENQKDKYKKITSIVRMLFDTPTADIQPTFIDTVHVMANKESDKGSHLDTTGTRVGSSALSLSPDTSFAAAKVASSEMVVVGNDGAPSTPLPPLVTSSSDDVEIPVIVLPGEIPPRTIDTPPVAPPIVSETGDVIFLPVDGDGSTLPGTGSGGSGPPTNSPVPGFPVTFPGTSAPVPPSPPALPDDNTSPQNPSDTPIIIPTTNPCIYDNCDECDPLLCFPKCCCCASIDSVSISQIRCHKQAVLSCNIDGTAPGPNSPPFPPTCPKCLTACETVLGIGAHVGLDCDDLISTGTAEGWWSLPTAYGPCTCECKQQGSDDCELTCVTCEGLYCQSDLLVSSNNCNYNMYLRPGSGCYSSQTFCVFCNQDFPRNWFVRIVGHSYVQNPFAGAFLCAVGSGVKVKSFHPADNGLRYEIVLQSVNKQTDPFLSNIDNNPCTWRFSNWDTPYVTSSSGPLETCPDIEGMEIPGITHTAGIIEVLENEIKLTIGGSCRSKPNPSEYPPFPMGHLIETFLVYKIPFSGDCEAEYTFDPDAYDFDESYLKVDGINRGVGVISHYGPFVISPRDFVTTSGFISTADCLDYTPIRLKKDSPECDCPNDPIGLSCQDSLPQHCFDFPVKKCFPNQPNCDCADPTTLNACGTVVVITPVASKMLCCSEIGCDCPVENTPDQICCGPSCPGSEICINGQRLYSSLKEAQDAVWCECFLKAAFVDPSTPNCSACCCPDLSVGPGDPHYPCDQLAPNDPLLFEDPPRCCTCSTAHTQDCCACCLQFHDGQGGFYTKCKSQSDLEVKQIWDLCVFGPGGGGGGPGPIDPPPTWNPPNEETPGDQCIVGEPAGPLDEDRCDDAHAGCASVRHPSTTVLNNGIGLVACEVITDNSIIKIQQFKTTVKNKILANRDLAFGRLEHNSKWTTTGKLYYYGSLPEHLLVGNTGVVVDNPDTWKDSIGFKTGPLAKQIFPLTSPPIGEDSIGKYLSFIIPTDTELSFPFSSGDDAYNVGWFIYDFEDDGVIGQSHDSTTDGKNYLISDREVIDQFLLLPKHIYNGKQVPVAFPYITSATNYLNTLENSQFVYVVYQALENSKWNVYLRQIRLSEYNRNEQIQDSLSSGNVVSVNDIDTVIYKVKCISDNCASANSSQYLLKRTIVLELLMSDGREILNSNLTGDWGALCDGYAAHYFPKEKVFAQVSHTAVCDKCPTGDEFNDLFPNWDVGQEFSTIASVSDPAEIFSVLTENVPSPIELGVYSQPVTINGFTVLSSSISAVWYQDFASGSWKAINSPSLLLLNNFKGVDISEPVLLTENETGHSTHPVVRVNYNNHIYVAYETVLSGIQQIRVIGTQKSQNCLPAGVVNERQIDDTLDYFVSYNDFVYDTTVTANGINQLPDMVIDKNNVLHLTWQSNRDHQWEIYYANSNDSFENTRITKYNSKSFYPRIDLDNVGRVFIVWHDNRFGNYEVMLAYYNGLRVLPLYEQDAYLASIRNDGYEHYINEINVTLKNYSDSYKCYTGLVANFYSDRLLTNKKFVIAQSDWPTVFHITGMGPDTYTNTLNEDIASIGLPEDDYLHYNGLPVFDSTLPGSVVHLINFGTNNPSSIVSIQISIKANDVEADVPASPSSDWISIFTNTETVIDLPNIVGRYKYLSFRVHVSVPVPESVSIDIQSLSSNRLCLSPDEEKEMVIDLSPDIRIDSLGTQTSAAAITAGLSQNQSYFVTVEGEDADGVTNVLTAQKISASCSSCINKSENWNYKTCSLTIQIQNAETEVQFYNLKCKFYADKDRQLKITEFNASYGSNDLQYFTGANQVSADNLWSVRGLQVNPNEYTELVLYPSLSPTAGLLCGILYYVVIEYCSVLISDPDVTCTTLQTYDIVPWRCMCESERMESFGPAPINLRDRISWRSSAFGFSDTRITETHNNNVNPIIKMRSNGNGVIVYSSDRKESSTDKSDYKIFASVFSVVPDYNMYASGAQSAVSIYNQFVYQSDIPICENPDGETGCYNDQGEKTGTTLRGVNPSFALDQYDNIFLACEQYLDGEFCRSLIIDRQSIVKVHAGGASAQDLFKVPEIVQETITGCDQSNITGVSFVSNNQSVIASIVRKFAIKNEFVKYHITKNGQRCPVVSACKIDLIIIGTPECVSVRLRNGSQSDWSKWIPFNHQVSENVIETTWELPRGVGLKTIEMQLATYNGLTPTTSIVVAADYDRVQYNINFYRSPTPVTDPEESMTTVWETANRLSEFGDLPVASINAQIVDNSLVFPEQEYIFVEIEPNLSYMQLFMHLSDEEKSSGVSGIEPLLDYIQQGDSDQFDVHTRWQRNSSGAEVFRGYIVINRDNLGKFKDGLANIIVHFKHDCSDIHSSLSASKQFSKDSFNVPTENTSTSASVVSDAFANDRVVTGEIKHKIVIRPDEDPYFIFGDPNYRVKDE